MPSRIIFIGIVIHTLKPKTLPSFLSSFLQSHSNEQNNMRQSLEIKKWFGIRDRIRRRGCVRACPIAGCKLACSVSPAYLPPSLSLHFSCDGNWVSIDRNEALRNGMGSNAEIYVGSQGSTAGRKWSSLGYKIKKSKKRTKENKKK